MNDNLILLYNFHNQFGLYLETAKFDKDGYQESAVLRIIEWRLLE